MIKFDVFGTVLAVERFGSGWRVYRVGDDGKRVLVNVVIPEFIQESELAQYLDDLFHESARPHHPCVKRLSDSYARKPFPPPDSAGLHSVFPKWTPVSRGEARMRNRSPHTAALRQASYVCLDVGEWPADGERQDRFG